MSDELPPPPKFPSNWTQRPIELTDRYDYHSSGSFFLGSLLTLIPVFFGYQLFHILFSLLICLLVIGAWVWAIRHFAQRGKGRTVLGLSITITLLMLVMAVRFALFFGSAVSPFSPIEMDKKQAIISLL